MKSSICVVIDYGIGNTFSVMHALKSLGATAILTRDRNIIMNADRIILPGVGAFGRAAEQLREFGLDEIIHEYIQTERPFLGICVGMQLLMTSGNEFGKHRGLDIIKGSVDKIEVQKEFDNNLRVPLIGWYPLTLNTVKGDKRESLVDQSANDASYYFVHSYAAHPVDSESVLATVNHSGKHVVAAFQSNNVTGLQFHPERSGSAGLFLLNKYLKQ